MNQSIDDFWRDYTSLAYNQSNDSREFIFRGVTNAQHELVPSIGRKTKGHTGGDVESLEQDMLKEFRRLTVPVLNKAPSSNFEWLFLAQHYGLPTRLLDWSTNPLVALFFAAESNDEKDGAVYFLQHMVTDQYELFDCFTADYLKAEKAKPYSVFAIQPNQGNVIFVRPKYTDDRYLNQRSVFSCPKDPFSPLEIPEIKKVEFKGAWKREIRKRLRVMGISTSHIYPGLGGAASEVKSLIFDPVASGNTQIITLRAEIKLS